MSTSASRTRDQEPWNCGTSLNHSRNQPCFRCPETTGQNLKSSQVHSDQGCEKTIPGAGSCPSANPPGQSGTKWTQDKQLGSFSKHFFYCNNSSINFRLQDSELQALCGTRSRLKSQDLLCTTGINASTRHIILTIKYCGSIPAPQWSCSSFASHHPTPIPLEPVNSYLKNPKRML